MFSFLFFLSRLLVQRNVSLLVFNSFDFVFNVVIIEKFYIFNVLMCERIPETHYSPWTQSMEASATEMETSDNENPLNVIEPHW